MRATTILVVDDEPKIRRIVSSYLREEGFDVSEAASGEEGVELAAAQPDLIVLDVKLPGIDGIEALRQIRQQSDVPVILLTARAEETDRLIGLSVGADDYVTKPFSPRELVLRVKAILRRAGSIREPESDVVRFDGIVIDAGARTVEVDGVQMDLTVIEFDLLSVLSENPGRVLSRRQLIERVWSWDHYGDERVVDVHIRNLRQKIGDDAGDPRFVATARGVGYRFVANQP